MKNEDEPPESKVSIAIRWTIGIILICIAFWIGIHLPMQMWDRLRR